MPTKWLQERTNVSKNAHGIACAGPCVVNLKTVHQSEFGRAGFRAGGNRDEREGYPMSSEFGTDKMVKA